MPWRRSATFLVFAGACFASHAQPLQAEWTGSASLLHRRLVERTPTGGTLLTESGPVGQLQLTATWPLSGGGALASRITALGGELDYDGQTQAGAPLATTTRQGEFGADLLWRPLAPAAWGEAWLSLGALVNRRVIQGTPTAGGLDETSSAWMAGALWRSPGWSVHGAWRARVEAEARYSLRHRLHVDYHGLLDDSRLDGARKRQFALRLAMSAQDSPWEWALEWSRLSQPESAAVPVYRGGALFGTVRQPELSIRDVGLRLSRRF
jgi:hypothetical protein